MREMPVKSLPASHSRRRSISRLLSRNAAWTATAESATKMRYADWKSSSDFCALPRGIRRFWVRDHQLGERQPPSDKRCDRVEKRSAIGRRERSAEMGPPPVVPGRHRRLTPTSRDSPRNGQYRLLVQRGQVGSVDRKCMVERLLPVTARGWLDERPDGASECRSQSSLSAQAPIPGHIWVRTSAADSCRHALGR